MMEGFPGVALLVLACHMLNLSELYLPAVLDALGPLETPSCKGLGPIGPHLASRVTCVGALPLHMASAWVWHKAATHAYQPTCCMPGDCP